MKELEVEDLKRQLAEFKEKHNIGSKGSLAVVLHVTRMAIEKGLPLKIEELKTGSEGQVAGLGKNRIQSILKEYKIERVLAEEGGRTSRGSLRNASEYATFINENCKNFCNEDIKLVEKWWIEQILIFFSGKPFALKLDNSKSLKSIIVNIIEQAEKRQKENFGTTYVGTVLQHLVGAKLEISFADKMKIQHNSANASDDSTSRYGDFDFGDAVIHVTSFPQESLIKKCCFNINSGKYPMIITLKKRISVAESLLEKYEIEDRVEIIEIEQFISSNIIEKGLFVKKDIQNILINFVEKYNEIVSEYETDPSLQIKI